MAIAMATFQHSHAPNNGYATGAITVAAYPLLGA